jgi:inosose dehydratase
VIHPHAGTPIRTADEIARVMDRIGLSVLGLCLVRALRFGGADPARRSRLPPPSGVTSRTATSVLDGEAEGKGLDEALRRGVFCQLGAGDSGIDGVIEALRTYDYAGWLVIEQDQFLGPSDTPESVVAGQRANRDYLRALGI